MPSKITHIREQWKPWLFSVFTEKFTGTQADSLEKCSVPSTTPKSSWPLQPGSIRARSDGKWGITATFGLDMFNFPATDFKSVCAALLVIVFHSIKPFHTDERLLDSTIFLNPVLFCLFFNPLLSQFFDFTPCNALRFSGIIALTGGEYDVFSVVFTHIKNQKEKTFCQYFWDWFSDELQCFLILNLVH